MENMITIYLVIASGSAGVTALCLLETDIDGIDNFWDWVIYNLLWIVQPIKALIKFITRIWKTNN